MRAHLDLGAANPAAQTQLPIAAGCFLPSLRGQIFLFSCSAGDVLRQKYRVSYINSLTHLEIRGHLLVDFKLQVPFCIFRGLKTALDLLLRDLSRPQHWFMACGSLRHETGNANLVRDIEG